MNGRPFLYSISSPRGNLKKYSLLLTLIQFDTVHRLQRVLLQQRTSDKMHLNVPPKAEAPQQHCLFETFHVTSIAQVTKVFASWQRELVTAHSFMHLFASFFLVAFFKSLVSSQLMKEDSRCRTISTHRLIRKKWSQRIHPVLLNANCETIQCSL